MSSREFAEWLAYSQLEPFDELRADLRAGIVASTVANVYRDTSVRAEAFQPNDFMPFARKPESEPEERQPWQDQLRMVEMWNAALGGADKRRQA